MNNERIDKYLQPKNIRSSAFQPLYYALVLIAGLIGGSYLSDENILTLGAGSGENPNKLVSLIDFIEDHYVDSVDKGKMIDDAIASILSNLDPHSYYIAPEDLARSQEELSGGFQGIGVEFLILRDSLMVVRTIPGGPSESSGVRSGDRIVEVDGKPISGKSLDSDLAQKLLKGPAGSKVKVGLRRSGQSARVDVEITRGSIPIESVPVAYKVDQGIGYIKVERFAQTTYEEFRRAADQLVTDGCSRFILDLRGNGGGYLDQAVAMVEEFLTPGKIIVYTEGIHDGKDIMTSEKQGRYRDLDVVVLIDQGSASASEIVAGALQDWDRSVTVGRRSFGKGLVQREITLPDKSALRLTVSRYYTPTGRCIQRPYGDSVDYRDDFHQRYLSGELLSADSIHLPDSLKRVTPGGRVVYGGGGIVPDVFVALDSTLLSGVLAELNFSGIIREFTFDYTDQHRSELGKFKTGDEFVKKFKVSDQMISDLALLAMKENKDVSRQEVMSISDELKLRIKAQMARALFSEKEMYMILEAEDPEFGKALEIARDYRRFAAIPSESLHE